MKVGVTGLRGLPHVMGGIETHCEQLYPRLAALRPLDRFFVIARTPYVDKGRRDYRGLTIVPVFTINNRYVETLLNTLLGVGHVRFRLRCGLIHIHGIGPALFAPLARLFGLKVIVTHHGANFQHSKWNALARAAFRLGEWCAVHFSHALIVVSRNLAADLKLRHPRHSAHIAHVTNGASLLPPPADPAADADVLREIGVEPGGYLLGVGRLVPEKGFADLVEAFLASRSPMKLVIAGRADHEDDYSRELLARASDKLIFAGFQSQERLGALYRNAALFVLSSYHEGMPIAALEAAAAGTPMLLSDIPANLEIGLSPEHYYPVADIVSLTSRLEQDARDFAIDSAEICSRYDWEKVALATSEIYDRVAGSSGRNRG